MMRLPRAQEQERLQRMMRLPRSQPGASAGDDEGAEIAGAGSQRMIIAWRY